MHSNILQFDSIAHIHEVMSLPAPAHPLISMINSGDLEMKPEMDGMRMTANLYCIAQKTKSPGLGYGRKHYDFEEGMLMFIAPHQVLRGHSNIRENEGWMLFFHPDLIRTTPLGSSIGKYAFFGYTTYQALQMTDSEKEQLEATAKQLRQMLAVHGPQADTQQLATLLKQMLDLSEEPYQRYQSRGGTQPADVLAAFESALHNWFESDLLADKGIPSVQYLADCVHLSPNYLSDLLKQETGKNAKEHINLVVLEKAKHRLLTTRKTVSEIAYALGFNYPHYFSRMFKTHTGYSPKEFRAKQQH